MNKIGVAKSQSIVRIAAPPCPFPAPVRPNRWLRYSDPVICWSKAQLRDELIQVLSEQLIVAERAHQGSLEGATHEEARPENDKDTRALEQSYLARGQAQRVMELKDAIAKLCLMPADDGLPHPKCIVGSIVEVDDGKEHSHYFIAEVGGGTRLAQSKVQVVTPQSPLGRALLGSGVDDDVEVSLGHKQRVLSIVALL